MTPLYDLVVVLHVLAAVVGFGALLATGSYAGAARRSGARHASPAVLRYFRPGSNLASAALYLVPVFGLLLLDLDHWQDASAPYPWVGLFLWLLATGIASAVLWPSEREIQQLLERPDDDAVSVPRLGPPGSVSPPGSVPGSGSVPPVPGWPVPPPVPGRLDDDEALALACRRCERAAAVTSLCFVVALFFMVVQPG